MRIEPKTVVDIGHAVLCVLFPWAALFAGDPLMAAIVALTIPLHASALRSFFLEPYRSTAVAGSAFAAIGFGAGWTVTAAWLVVAGCVGGAALVLTGRRFVVRPDGLDVVVGVAWSAALWLRPELVGGSRWSWVVPIIAVLATRRAIFAALKPASGDARRLGPPPREVRGTLTISGCVAGRDGLARTRPLDVEILAGSTLAILGDDDVLVDLAEAVIGRRPLIDGQVCIDGIPTDPKTSLMAVVAQGEPFVIGNLEVNLAALRGEPLDTGTYAAVREACALDEVERSVAGGFLGADGRPLRRFQRLQVQAARILASHYRVLVVVDPMPWVNPVRAEIWRQIVVRASVGRTALWITGDRVLAGRAGRAVELRQGRLQPVDA